MEWFYLDANRQQMPFDPHYLAGFISEGRIQAETLVWSKELGDWKPASAAFPQHFPGAAPQTQVQTQPQQRQQPVQRQTGLAGPSGGDAPRRQNEEMRELVKDLASYISANSGWLKLFGIVSIIGGIFSLIFIYGGFMIWMGLMLLKAADEARVAEQTGVPDNLEVSLYNLGRFFKVNGILLTVLLAIQVIAIVMTILFWGALIAFIGAAAASMPESSGTPDGL